MSKLVIFDLDGTLLDTLEDLADAVNHALAAHGFPPHSSRTIMGFVGNGVQNLIRKSLPSEAGETALEAVEGEFHTHYALHAQDKTAPYEGVVELLAGLKEQGVELAVLSNKSHLYVQELVERYFSGLVDLALGQREGVPKKPDPTAVREILAHFGRSPEETSYVGDSGVDMRTGRAAGCHTVGVSWGFRTKEELQEQGAQVIIHKPQELFSLVVDR